MKNIIIVDMQKGFITERNKYLIERINKYLQDNTFDNIYFTKCVNNEKSPFTTILNWTGVTKEQEQEIVLKLPQKAKIIIKDTYGISDKEIQKIKELGISEIEICGTDIDACCLAIAFNLFDNGIKPKILLDLCGTICDNENINDGIKDLIKRQFGI